MWERGCWRASIAALAAASLLASRSVGGEECQGACSDRRPPYGTAYNARYFAIPAEYAAGGDCVGARRAQMRPYPGHCYGHSFTVTDRESWWNLFAEIGGDLQYTFDFILHDPVAPFSEVNQFWYLIAYLQKLARSVTDPKEVLAELTYRRTMTHSQKVRKDKIDKLSQKVQAEMDVLDSLIAEAIDLKKQHTARRNSKRKNKRGRRRPARKTKPK